MAGTSDQISKFMFGTKKPYDLGIWPRFRPYGVFTLRKPYKCGFSCTSGNADVADIMYSFISRKQHDRQERNFVRSPIIGMKFCTQSDNTLTKPCTSVRLASVTTSHIRTAGADLFERSSQINRIQESAAVPACLICLSEFQTLCLSVKIVCSTVQTVLGCVDCPSWFQTK